MASGTVGYTDTRGSKDYTSIIANQIGKRLKEASDMASDERSFAEGKAEAGGTSLSEAGIGRGYFFKRALGSRFGGDAIARTKGRMGAQGAGKNPAANYKQRFRGGFDYNVTNQNITDTAPLTGALVTGLRGVESGLGEVSSAIQRQDKTLSSLARSQADMAKATMFNGYLFQMFATQQRRERERRSARNEERSIEGGQIDQVTGRGMINITPPSGSGGSGGKLNSIQAGDVVRRGLKQALPRARQAKSVASGMKLLGPKQAGIAKLPQNFLSTGADLGNLTYKGNKMMMPLTKGFVNMATKMPGVNTLTTLIKKADQFVYPGVQKAITKSFGKGAEGIKNLKKFAVTANALDGPASLLKTFAPITTALDHKAYLQVAASGGKTKKFVDTATTVAGSSRTGINAVTSSDDLMKGVKQVDDVTDGLGTARTLAAGADAGASPGMLRRFFMGTKPKGLVRGSKLTRMLIKNPAGKIFLKKLPLIGAVAGTIFAIQRLMEGDLLGAGLEFGSGLLGTIPGKGTAASLAIDGFLLARDFGAVPFAKGGIVKGRRGKGLYTTLGAGLPSVIGEGGSDEAVLPLNKKTFLNFGRGFIDAIKEKQSDYAKITSMGVFAGIGNARSGGLFDGLVDSVGDTISGVKDTVGNVLQKINPANLFKPNANGQNFFQRMGSGVTNWWKKGIRPNEGKMSWKDLISDDWNQRQRTAGAGKGGWNPFRGMPGYGSVKNFLTGNPGNEIAGGFQTGPTPLIRQSVSRGAGFLMNPKAAIMAALMKPTALADGTLTGVQNQMESMNLQNPNNGNAIATTVVNNNYYQNGASGGTESRDETLGQSFNVDLEKFITNYSIMSK